MAGAIERDLVFAALLLLLSVLVSKASERYGIPALLLFLGIGMLAGADGPGRIYFDDPFLAQFIGVVALTLILFSGGLETDMDRVRPVFAPGLLLSTLGVIVTAVVMGLLASYLLAIPLPAGLLLGAIVSSTDAAAVFSILRAKGIALRGRLVQLLEFESGSNDPMAVLLTVGLVEYVRTGGGVSPGLLLGLAAQFPVGALIGYAAGKGIIRLINRIRLPFEGLYPVLTLALVSLTYSGTALIGGSGFLAVYVAAIVVGNTDFIHKRSIIRFHDGLAWLAQIAMFLTLGLLVFPNRLITVAGMAGLLTICLVLVARPLSVFLCLIPSQFTVPEKLLVSWVGLRGAVPIVLATYPLLARLPQAETIFNVVFFVVLVSVLFQGTTVAKAAKLLKLDAPAAPVPPMPLEYTPVEGLHSALQEIGVKKASVFDGCAIVDARFPEGFLVLLVRRGREFIQPTGSTVMKAGDVLLVLGEGGVVDGVKERAGENKK